MTLIAILAGLPLLLLIIGLPIYLVLLTTASVTILTQMSVPRHHGAANHVRRPR